MVVLTVLQASHFLLQIIFYYNWTMLSCRFIKFRKLLILPNIHERTIIIHLRDCLISWNFLCPLAVFSSRIKPAYNLVYHQQLAKSMAYKQQKCAVAYQLLFAVLWTGEEFIQTSPFSRGTILEKSVVQMTWSSAVISLLSGVLKNASQSLGVSAKYCHGFQVSP